MNVTECEVKCVDMSEEELSDWGSPILMEKNEEKQEHFFIEEENNCQDSGMEKEGLSTDRLIIMRTKKEREDDEIGWTKVEKKVKLRGQIKTEVIISSKEKLPKQFAIAKLFTALNFINIIKIKYINPYKIRMEVPDEDYATKVINCLEFEKRGWRVHRETDVNVSHGIIKNVDLELTEEQALEAIKCPNEIKVLSFKRLKRRNEAGEWIPSEVARIDFNCSYLPAHIYIDNLRVKVDPYIFPVTQCSRCWKFGHPKARCASRSIVCPKCCGSHENCETMQYKCVNCNGDHMALNRICPVYLREKRLRELMAEFNCSYKGACNLYVRPESIGASHQTINYKEENQNITTSNSFMNLPCDENTSHKYTPLLPEFSQLFTPKRPESSPCNKNNKRDTNSSINQPERDRCNQPERDRCNQPDCTPQRSTDDNDAHSNINDCRKVQFSELMVRLKEILFIKNFTLGEKVHNCAKCVIEWLVLVVVGNISEWPYVSCIIDFISKFING